ncbi:DUF7316 family protein [Mycetocola spongiae]|uniref:DUF7316 family protein n=1 Tax=Mycetocola spongiae TaxID=2859226 RepID=UPI001CF48D12|nr:hypothetical protein [Mycetocola spongiae]UCR89279.1 hypothetical protein KXZ72_00760 [Mycetocola spongiae]
MSAADTITRVEYGYRAPDGSETWGDSGSSATFAGCRYLLAPDYQADPGRHPNNRAALVKEYRAHLLRLGIPEDAIVDLVIVSRQVITITMSAEEVAS